MHILHSEYKRINRDADTAVLFIHGILGTPNHFNDFVRIVPKNFSVYNILLKGHGKGVRDFSRASMKEWENQVEKVVDELSLVHTKIFIIAHSMGGLLAIEQAVKNKKIVKLFLLALPLKLWLKPALFLNSLKVYFDRIKPDDKAAIAAKRCYGIGHSKNIFEYAGWIPRFIELFKKIRFTRKRIGRLNTPCIVFQSKKDEMVSIKSTKVLEQNPTVSVINLNNSGHYYYSEKDFDLLLKAFKNLFI